MSDEAERDLQQRIDDNIFRLIDAGHDFSPAGLVKDNTTSVSRDDLLGRHGNEGPENRDLAEAVVGDIVVADDQFPDTACQIMWGQTTIGWDH